MAVLLQNLSLLLLFISISISTTISTSNSTSTTSPSPSPMIGDLQCKDTLVSASPCLPYISSPPNNQSSTPPPDCCAAFTSISFSGDLSCLCYLLRSPPLFGFPIDRSRLLSLSSLCPLPNVSSPNAASVEFICSVLQALPPLGSAGDGTPDFPVAGPEASPPSIISAPDNSPSSMIITPEASKSPPYPSPDLNTENPPDFDTQYPDTSSATKLRFTYSGFMNLLGDHPKG